MNKKQLEAKQTKSSPMSAKANRLNKLFAVGNFCQARRCAHEIISSPQSTDLEIRNARAVVKMTLPDPWALLVGLLVAVFSLSVAYVSAFAS